MIAKNTSVIKIYNTLLVTVPADPDDNTITELQEHVLESMEKCVAKGVILDISMVETLDSFFARTITETIQMVAVMGGDTVIAGMRPSVAITAIQLGLNLGNVRTALNVELALDMVADFRPGGQK
ncbi:MAG: anti-anti-sigma factor [Firmicutes bacterium HGW-Firmicutes-15]|nr:MAG: anti-anti-sigma factor [Firmicutes bacterium HGW-Firmicutes-15]